MLALDSLIVVALISGVGALLIAIVGGLFGWLSNRKSHGNRRASAIQLTHNVLTETIEWQDGEIAELRTENKHLRLRVRRLENDLTKQRSE